MREMSISEQLRAQAKAQTRREEGEDWRDNYQWKAADTIDALVAALEEARTAMNDWTVSHAGDMCGDESVNETYARIIGGGGTLGYICDVSTKIDAALALARGGK